MLVSVPVDSLSRTSPLVSLLDESLGKDGPRVRLSLNPVRFLKLGQDRLVLLGANLQPACYALVGEWFTRHLEVSIAPTAVMHHPFHAQPDRLRFK